MGRNKDSQVAAMTPAAACHRTPMAGLFPASNHRTSWIGLHNLQTYGNLGKIGPATKHFHPIAAKRIGQTGLYRICLCCTEWDLVPRRPYEGGWGEAGPTHLFRVFRCSCRGTWKVWTRGLGATWGGFATWVVRWSIQRQGFHRPLAHEV